MADNQPLWQETLVKIPQLPQTQESLNDQLRKLRIIANKFGFYDAADHIRYNILKESKNDNNTITDTSRVYYKRW